MNSNAARMIAWIALSAYFLFAAAGAGHFTLSLFTMITGFMIARNYCGLLHEEQPMTNTNDMPQLLPCPFCGGTAELNAYVEQDGDFAEGCAMCAECEAEGPVITCMAVGLSLPPGIDAEAAAISAWNNRQSQQAQVPEGWDAQDYATMRDEITYWKNRALETDEVLERIANDMAPTHMGEPVFNVSCQHQAAAWMSVANLLNELSPGWIIQEGLNAEEAALKAIRELADDAPFNSDIQQPQGGEDE